MENQKSQPKILNHKHNWLNMELRFTGQQDDLLGG